MQEIDSIFCTSQAPGTRGNRDTGETVEVLLGSRLVLFNARKRQTLEIFSDHGAGLRHPEYAAEAGFYPARAAFSYLLRLHRFALLERRRDFRDRILYRLSPAGARWLLRAKGRL